jgi:hypothetical protein
MQCDSSNLAAVIHSITPPTGTPQRLRACSRDRVVDRRESAGRAERSPAVPDPTTLISFCALANCADGANPTTGLLADANGNLFGTTGAGAHGDGTVFEITNSGFVSAARFSSFGAELVIDGARQASFVLDARFSLGATSDGINPTSEPVTFEIGPYAATIPAGSFRELPPGKRSTVYTFIGKEDNVRLALDIVSFGGNSHQFGAAGRLVNLTGPNRMLVSLRIGDDSGSTVVKAIRLP